MTSLADVLGLLDTWYQPEWAQSWDSVGLISGNPSGDIRRIHIAIDPTLAVAQEAVKAGADLLITHHPLWLGGVDRIAGGRGRVITELQVAGCALFVAHTNADVAVRGVSDALGAALGLRDLRVMSGETEEMDQWVTHIPPEFVDQLLDALAPVGAGRLGSYDRCAFIAEGTGTFRPGPGAQPYTGQIGEIERVSEARVEFVASPRNRFEIARVLRSVHPYEEPSFSVIPTKTPSRRGLGRVGDLPEPISLGQFVAHVARSLPRTAAGIRATGNPEAMVRTVAVAGGSCLDHDGDAAGSGADVFVTSDAKHHRAQDARLPIIDVPHWASEFPWTEDVGARLREALESVAVEVSKLVTDPWTMAAGDRVDMGL